MVRQTASIAVLCVLILSTSSAIHAAYGQENLAGHGVFMVEGNCGMEEIQYEITNGVVQSISAQFDAISVLVELDTSHEFSSGGEIVLKLPRTVIDDEFVIFADEVHINYQEINSTQSYRTIKIDFASGTQSIEILGDRIGNPSPCPVEPERCFVAPAQENSGGGLVLESAWHRDTLPFVFSFNTTTIGNEAILRLGVYDNKTGLPLCAVSYIVDITEAGSNETLLREVFHAENGILVLNIVHDNETRVAGAYKEHFLLAWVANTTAPIVIHTPEISMDRAYDVRAHVLGVYDIRNLVPPDQIPQADFVWEAASGTNTDRVLIVPEFGSLFPLIIVAVLIGAVLGTRYLKMK